MATQLSEYPALNALLNKPGQIRPEKVKIAVVGTLRQVFSVDRGIERFHELINALREDPRAEVVTLDAIEIENGIIWAGDHANIDRASNWLCQQKIDGLLVVPVNYGDENAASEIAVAVQDALKVPISTYVWPDDPIAEDGKRTLDNECGIFPMRQQMRVRLGRNPDYFPFCDIGDESFKEAWSDMIRVCSGIHSVRNIACLQLGANQPTFPAVEADMTQFRDLFGFRLVTVDLVDLVSHLKERLADDEGRADDKEYQAVLADMRRIFNFEATQEQLPQLDEKLTLTLIWIIDQMIETQCNCVTIRCWPEMFAQTGMMICTLNGLLYAAGRMAPCETDKPGMWGSALLHGFGIGDENDWNVFADLTRWDNGRPLMWHCGPFSVTGLRDDGPGCLRMGWIFEGITHGGLLDGQWGQIDDLVTFVQLRPNADGELQLVAWDGRIVNGPETIGTHFYVELEDSEEAWDFVMDNPFDHHNSGRVGEYIYLIERAAPWLGLNTEPAILEID